MVKAQTEITISLKKEIAETIERVTDNQVKIMKLTTENSEMLCTLLTSQSIFKAPDNQNTKELNN